MGVMDGVGWEEIASELGRSYILMGSIGEKTGGMM